MHHRRYSFTISSEWLKRDTGLYCFQHGHPVCTTAEAMAVGLFELFEPLDLIVKCKEDSHRVFDPDLMDSSEFKSRLN